MGNTQLHVRFGPGVTGTTRSPHPSRSAREPGQRSGAAVRRPAHEGLDGDAVRRVGRVRLEVRRPPLDQGRRALRVAPRGVRESHGDLRQAAPQLPLGLRRALPRVLEHLVRVERPSGVQQRLRLGQRGGRRTDDALRCALLTGRAVGQRPAQRVAGPGVAGTPRCVTVTVGRGIHAGILSRTLFSHRFRQGGLISSRGGGGWLAEDGSTQGRPRTDPRSTSDRSGPGGGGAPWPPFRARLSFRCALLSTRRSAPSRPRPRAPARGARARRPGPVGTVGRELEGPLVALAGPGRRVTWPRIRAVLDALGPLPGGSRVSLEPGGQVELSGPPLDGIGAAVAALRTDRRVLADALAGDGLGLALLGTDPLRPPTRVHPGARYAAMQEHFTAVGCRAAGLAMMTSTASLQVNLDAGPPEGWSARIALAHQLGPVLIAVSACSPLLSGRRTGWRSTRQKIWGDLDQARCGPLLGGADPAGEWAAYALSAPVMLVREDDGDGAVPVRARAAFADWLTGEAHLGRRPTAQDLDYHLTTLFPPVRPRGFLEIRYLDAAPEPWWPALAAVTATLLDDPVAADLAADAVAPVAGAWDRAARLGLTDTGLHRAAVRCLAAALIAVPAPLRGEVEALAGLVESGRSPGDLLPAGDPATVLLSATETPEAP